MFLKFLIFFYLFRNKYKASSFAIKNTNTGNTNQKIIESYNQKEKVGFLERKKYQFLIKELDAFGKTYNASETIKRFEEDINQFKEFLNLFRDDQPKFSKNLLNPLSKNLLDSSKEKLEFAFNIVKCQNEFLTTNIVNFKTHFHGEEGKALFEALFIMRENYNKMNANEKLFYSNMYG